MSLQMYYKHHPFSLTILILLCVIQAPRACNGKENILTFILPVAHIDITLYQGHVFGQRGSVRVLITWTFRRFPQPSFIQRHLDSCIHDR